ncbi:MAG: hypothetical protein HYV97_16360 [Bdellovibrio sp.]|nr:hypothetical protein [Bdellovibrio sp.]
MGQNLKIVTEVQGRNIKIKLKGHINEDADLAQIPLSGFDQYNFDFNEVELINSCGIRDWIVFLDKLGPKSKIIYSRCPQIIIEQINMVQGFLRPNCVIESFYAPYFCEHHDTEKKILLKVSEVKARKAPKMCCEETGEEMEFDAIEEQYFYFIKG